MAAIRKQALPLMMRYPIAIEPKTDETDYGVVIPDLPGCFSAGETLEQAIARAEEAGLAWIDAALEAGDAIPPPSSLEALRARPDYAGWVLSVVTIDPSALDDAAERVQPSSCQDGFFGGSTRTRGRPAKRDRVTSRNSRSADKDSNASSPRSVERPSGGSSTTSRSRSRARTSRRWRRRG